jgi:ferritin-like metal-binding protein YciE
MGQSEQMIVQYLSEAHATEVALTRVLQSQIAMTPRGTYRSGLEKHLKETRSHADRVQQRLADLGESRNPIQIVNGAAQSVVGQVLALAKTPLDLVRGTGGEEKVLKNAKDAASTEALEIATYTAIERFAQQVGDVETARLAASIRKDEERMLARILDEIPKLTDAVVGAEVNGNGAYDVTKTGAADNVRDISRKTAKTARKTKSRAKSTARQTRKVPGVARAEGRAKGAVADAGDLPIARYDKLNADEIAAKLPSLSQIDLAKVATYERKNDNRTTVLGRIDTLRGNEPWPGYDEQSASEIERALGQADDSKAREVRTYERSHKERTGVIKAAEREVANA